MSAYEKAAESEDPTVQHLLGERQTEIMNGTPTSTKAEAVTTELNNCGYE